MDTPDNSLQPSAEVAESVGLATEPPSREPSKRLTSRVKTVLIGTPRVLADHSGRHQLSLIAFLAWAILGADGLSSSCYGPVEAFHAIQEDSATCQVDDVPIVILPTRAR